MQALILAGGLGTRLRPLTCNTPKPIVPIGNQPFLLRQIESLKKAGVADVTLALNYQPSAIQDLLGDGAAFGVKLRYLIEPAPMGTAGAYKFAEQFLHQTTVVLNGDILTDIDLSLVAAAHHAHTATATIVLTQVENPTAYGLVEVGNNEDVLKFWEKPTAAEAEKIGCDTINAGIYILEPEVLDLIPNGESYSFEYQLFPGLLARRKVFKAFVARDDYWIDIGTQQRYRQTHFDLMTGKIKSFQAAKSQNFFCAADAEIDETSCVADACRIEAGARIINSFIGANVTVKENAVVRNSVVWADTEVDCRAEISDAIIGRACRIGKNAVVSNNSILGDNSVLTDYSCY